MTVSGVRHFLHSTECGFDLLREHIEDDMSVRSCAMMLLARLGASEGACRSSARGLCRLILESLS